LAAAVFQRVVGTVSVFHKKRAAIRRPAAGPKTRILFLGPGRGFGHVG